MSSFVNRSDLRLCSFCRKNEDEVQMLVEGPNPWLFLCEECVKTVLGAYQAKYKDLPEANDVEQGYERIVREIRFPPEYYHSGMTILSNFAKIIRSKYSNSEIKVAIQQKDTEIILIIESEEGCIEKIKETMHQYSMVLCGDMMPEEFCETSAEAIELKSQLRIAKVQLETQKDILESERRANDDSKKRLENLESQYRDFTCLFSKLLDHAHEEASALLKALKTLSNRQTDSVKQALALLSSVIDKGIDAGDEEAVKQALTTVKLESPGLFEKVNDILLNSVSGAGGQFLHEWLSAIYTVLTK